jgi:hypothetical protein
VCARTPKQGREGRPVAPEGPATGTPARRGPREGPRISYPPAPGLLLLALVIAVAYAAGATFVAAIGVAALGS